MADEKVPDIKENTLEESVTVEQPKNKFMEPSYHLLKEMREQAPGTHKHSQSVVSMVENVCAAIDMDPSTLRLAALYHDVGKLINPVVFSENQGKDNIHHNLEPWISHSLITRHVSDSIMILTAEGFPAEVIKIVSQHHGTSVLKSIFNKERSINKKTNSALFRYKTPKPDCVESLILMLCDVMEASSRSVYIEQKKDTDPALFVASVYNKLHLDGQFDNVSILLGKLKKIQAAIISDVASNFQKRVAYDEIEPSYEEIEPPKEER